MAKTTTTKRPAVKSSAARKPAAARPTSRATKRAGKSKAATKAARPARRKKPTGLAKVVAVAGGVGAVAVGAVQTLVHKGEELVGRVMGTDEKPATKATRRVPRVTKGRARTK